MTQVFNITNVLENLNPKVYEDIQFNPDSDFKRKLTSSKTAYVPKTQKEREKIEEEKRALNEVSDFFDSGTKSNEEVNMIEFISSFNLPLLPKIFIVSMYITTETLNKLIDEMRIKLKLVGSTPQNLILTIEKIISNLISSSQLLDFFNSKIFFYYNTVNRKNDPSLLSFFVSESDIRKLAIDENIYLNINGDKINIKMSINESNLKETISRIETIKEIKKDEKSITEILSLLKINSYSRTLKFLYDLFSSVSSNFQVDFLNVLVLTDEEIIDPLSIKFLEKLNEAGWNILTSFEKVSIIVSLTNKYPLIGHDSSIVVLKTLKSLIKLNGKNLPFKTLTDKIISLLPLISGVTRSNLLIHFLTKEPVGAEEYTYFTIPKEKIISSKSSEKNPYLTDIVNKITSISVTNRNANDEFQDDIINNINKILKNVDFKNSSVINQISFIQAIVNFIVNMKLSITNSAYIELTNPKIFDQYKEIKVVNKKKPKLNTKNDDDYNNYDDDYE